MTVPASFLATRYAGFSSQVQHFFNETSRSMDGNVVTIVFELKDPNSSNAYITKQQLEEGLEDYLSDFTLTCEGLTVNAPGTYTVVGDVIGSVYLGGSNKTNAPFVINFNAEQMEDVHDTEGGLLQGTLVVNQQTDPGTTGPTPGVTKEDGKVIVVIDGKEQEYSPTNDKFNVDGLAKPEKEGAEFEGWYFNDKFTEPAKGEIYVKPGTTVWIYAKFVSNFTPDVFEKTDKHFAYIIGYPDGTVRPDGNITRAEAAAIFFRLLKADVREANLTTENSFVDVNAPDWYNTAISTMAKLGIVKGRTETEYKPNEFITRAEFAAICARFDDSSFEAVESFTDIGEHWAKEEINEAAARGWVNGYEDNTFRPNNFITRAEAVSMINKVLGRQPETVDDLIDGMITWPDNADTSEWYYLAIQEATNAHKYIMKNEIHEKWTELLEKTDWTKYE